MHNARRAENGFLLVEALFAFVIVAMMSALVYTTVSQVSHAATRLIERRNALLLAQSVLAGASVDSRVRPIGATGSDGNLRWSVAVDSYQPEDSDAAQLRKVTVTIKDASGTHQLARLSALGNGH
jgi:type II secretory pathway pseudopilin PulG